MTREGSGGLTLALSIIAAVLALAAAVVEYVRRGEVRVSLIAAGIFLLAFGFGARRRLKPSD